MEFVIQIQLLLKLNVVSGIVVRYLYYSNTTLVKVKFSKSTTIIDITYYIQIQLLLKLNFNSLSSTAICINSNTTLVKVKSKNSLSDSSKHINSNTTLVKVKLGCLFLL